MDKTLQNLKSKNYDVQVVEKAADALEAIKKIIPANASVMNGSSITLEQVGFVDFLKSGQHNWNNLHSGILQEDDPGKQNALRKQALLADYYLGSVHALTEAGEFLIASNTGSQLPHLAYSSTNLILVVGQQKIVPDLNAAMERLEKTVIPLENKRMQERMGTNTQANKILIFKNENPWMGRKIHVILVKEELGF